MRLDPRDAVRFSALRSSAEILAGAANPYHAARTRTVSAAGLAPKSGEVVTQFQSDSSRTDSPVRVLNAQPRSPVSVGHIPLAKICPTFPRIIVLALLPRSKGEPLTWRCLIWSSTASCGDAMSSPLVSKTLLRTGMRSPVRRYAKKNRASGPIRINRSVSGLLMPLSLRERLTMLMPPSVFYRQRIAQEARTGEPELAVLAELVPRGGIAVDVGAKFKYEVTKSGTPMRA
jgi:hypothetical protein